MLIIKFLMVLFLVSNLFATKYATILAAANLSFVFPEMIQVFYKQYPNADVHIQYEGSGALTKNILNGEHYDLFLSANMLYPEIVYKNQKAAEAPKVYTQGKLVFYIPKILQKKYKKEKFWKTITKKEIQTIVIANKKSAPYGTASIEVLKSYKVYKKVENKIKYFSDIATAVYELLWNDEVGFLPKSALLFFANEKKSKDNWVEIEQTAYSPIIQGYVFSNTGKKNKNAVLFLNFLLSKKGQSIFKKYGYVIIKNTKKENSF